MVRDHGNPRIAVVLFQDGYRFIYFLYCMLRQDSDCDVTVRTLYMYVYKDMGRRKFRLARHRKNEERNTVPSMLKRQMHREENYSSVDYVL